MSTETIPQCLSLKAGEPVEVRSREEILSTLDQNGCLDNLPFMPEMFAFCGQQLRVYKRAHKTCDTITYSGSQRIANAVHLEGIRCNGQAHGGCQAECLIFWKEAWMKRTGGVPVAGRSASPGHGAVVSVPNSPGCTEADVVAKACKIDGNSTSDPVYSCQATQMLHAGPPLAWWDLRQYWEDYMSGNFKLKWMLGVMCYATFNVLMNLRRGRIQSVLNQLYDAVQKARGRPCHPRAGGRVPDGTRTPVAKLNLQPGEMVRVKSFEAVRDTMNSKCRNRGLSWDAELVPYCGGEFRVHARVKRLIDERTGKMLSLKSEPLILEGVFCQARYSEHRYFCPRSTYTFWSETWLERIGQETPETPTVKAEANPPEKPMRDVVCLVCDRKFSLHMTITDHEKRNAKCPKCGSKNLRWIQTTRNSGCFEASPVIPPVPGNASMEPASK